MSVLFGHLLARGSVTIAAIVVARYFSAAEFASYSYFQITVSTLATFASFGLGTSAARHFAAFGIEDHFPLGALWLCGVLIAVMACAVLIVIPGRALGVDSELSHRAFAVGVLFVILNIVPAGAMLGLQLYRQAILTSLISAVVLFLMLGLAAWYRSISLAIAALIASLAAQWVGDSLVVMRKIGMSVFRRTAHINRQVLSQIADFAGPMFLVSLMNAAGLWMVARIMRVADASQVAFALYTIGMQWFSLVLVVPSVLTKISLSLLVKNRDAERGDVAWLGASLAFMSAAFGVAFVIAMTPWFAKLYGGNYSIDRWLVLLYMIATLANAPAGVIGNHIIVSGRQWTWFFITLIAMAAFVFVAWFLRGYGAKGGGVAISVSSMVLACLSMLVLVGKLNMDKS